MTKRKKMIPQLVKCASLSQNFNGDKYLSKFSPNITYMKNGCYISYWCDISYWCKGEFYLSLIVSSVWTNRRRL